MKVTVEEARDRLRKKAAKFQEILNNPLGKALIEMLEQEFYDVSLFDETNPDPQVTAYKCGQRDVVVYLRQLQRYDEAMKHATGTT